MKAKRKQKLTIIMTLVIVAGLSLSFLATQESRDFRIGKNLDIFFSLFRELNTFYVDEINPDKIVKTGIDNMLSSLDPYTTYLPESEMDDFNFATTGKYGGIGAMVRNDKDYTVVTEVYKGFPADKAGIKPGDIIKQVDGVSIKSLTTDKVSDRLKGDPGTPISVTVASNGREKECRMTRERIAVPSVPYYGMINQNTGYIRFTGFTQNCIEEVKKAAVDLKEHDASGIILDLRSNPGGLLTEAVEIVSLFVDPGNEVVSTKGKVKQFDSDFKTSGHPIDDKVKLAVIINRGSASASEIVAGAIQDLDRGVIVGQRSYGKGLVQITRPLSYNAQLKVTTAKYYIPSGRCIQALDYSHRNEDGSVGYIPDSLITEFKTRNGRIVKDGGGITPDVEVIPETLSQVATELYFRNFIFDYATQYYWSHPDIKSPDEIIFTDEDYADFRDFLKKRDFNYRTSSEEAFNDLMDIARKEKYYSVNKGLFDSLQTRITHNLDQDLTTFRNEITELMEEEIIGRYFYEAGAISSSLSEDEQVQKAVEVLGNPSMYSSILKGETGSILVNRTNGQRDYNIHAPLIRFSVPLTSLTRFPSQL